jgi:hypothetical protein
VTIFDYLRDIIVTKKGDLPLDQYVPFLVNRWLSFINPTINEAINENLNAKVFLENKELHYKTAISIFPKMKYCPKINYIKKVKEEETSTDNRIKTIAQNLEISVREASFLVSCID